MYPGILTVRLTTVGLLESWSAMDALPVGKACRAVRLLDIQSFELKSGVHEVLDQVWKRLVYVDISKGVVRIQEEGEGECLHFMAEDPPVSREIGDQLSLAEAVIGLKAYKEVDERMVQLWHNLDTAILSPRMNLSAESLPSVKQENVSPGSLSLTDMC